MYTFDDLVDTIVECLVLKYVGGGACAKPGANRGPNAAWIPKKGRSFLTEYDIKKALTPGAQELTISRDTIISPLALDWLALQGVRIVRK